MHINKYKVLLAQAYKLLIHKLSNSLKFQNNNILLLNLRKAAD